MLFRSLPAPVSTFGAIDKPNVLTGAGSRAKTASVDLPGHVDEGFITGAIQVSSSDEDLGATLKQQLRRGAQSRPPASLTPKPTI